MYRELCTRRLLVQERFDGFTLADTDAAGRVAASIATSLAEQLLRTTLEQVLGVGFFHADPHPGNIFAFDDGTLGLIDFGAVGRLDPIQQAAVVDILAALVRARRRRSCATASSASPTSPRRRHPSGSNARSPG